jgi:hypothetical protein
MVLGLHGEERTRSIKINASSPVDHGLTFFRPSLDKEEMGEQKKANAMSANIGRSTPSNT